MRVFTQARALFLIYCVDNAILSILNACGHHNPAVYTPLDIRSLLAATTSDTNAVTHKCPLCGMSTTGFGYENQNYVTLKNGQKIFTCGMDPHSFSDYTFDVTETAYIAANMAEFIRLDNEPCKAPFVCNECSTQDLRDPIDNAVISADNFKFVCLKRGQKIYFASDLTRDEYLANVAKDVRYVVESSTCRGAPCADGDKIVTLSLAAKSFKPQFTVTADAANGNSAESSSKFCSGEGSVMFNGFQSTVNGSCVRLFFKQWTLNSAWKYAFAFIGICLLAVGNEALVSYRSHVRKTLLLGKKRHSYSLTYKRKCRLVLASLYAIQMVVAYFAMLVVMTYEIGLFLALILGFGIGFLVFKDFQMEVNEKALPWWQSDPSAICLYINGMTCMENCGRTIENALQQVDGVTNVHIAFADKKAYVSGFYKTESLVAAVEAVGFNARLECTML